MSRRGITLVVNGREHVLSVDPDRTLLSVLRDDLDLTGSKYGCGEGRCGACTVLVDGETIYACRAKVGDQNGKAIVTIEGLATGDRLHPLQRAFLELDALQCGYCTPGMIVAGASLLDRNPEPTDEQIVAALDTHICRCGTYGRIVAAVKRAAAIRKEAVR
jgi:aerobic-type carbon monoxide dehydrogenase small subunit (CoxS/CutS family)